MDLIEILTFIRVSWSQSFADINCKFGWQKAGGHIEFFQCPDETIAIPIYYDNGRLIEMLVFSLSYTSQRVINGSCLEMIEMIKRKMEPISPEDLTSEERISEGMVRRIKTK